MAVGLLLRPAATVAVLATVAALALSDPPPLFAACRGCPQPRIW
ncbi:hypothetical protein [Mycolicibacterium mageritense]|nr:hypothetical protein [Mycolicibacterium mageritense]